MVFESDERKTIYSNVTGIVITTDIRYSTIDYVSARRLSLLAGSVGSVDMSPAWSATAVNQLEGGCQLRVAVAMQLPAAGPIEFKCCRILPTIDTDKYTNKPWSRMISAGLLKQAHYRGNTNFFKRRAKRIWSSDVLRWADFNAWLSILNQWHHIMNCHESRQMVGVEPGLPWNFRAIILPRYASAVLISSQRLARDYCERQWCHDAAG